MNVSLLANYDPTEEYNVIMAESIHKAWNQEPTQVEEREKDDEVIIETSESSEEELYSDDPNVEIRRYKEVPKEVDELLDSIPIILLTILINVGL